MFIGYARVSTKEQSLDLQIDALKLAGCEKFFMEKQSTKRERPELNKMLEVLRTGDTVVIWKLDRLGRTTLELIRLIDKLNNNGIGFKSLNDNFLDTTTANGKLIFTIFSALAEHERSMIQERTRAGLKAARLRNRLGGRPKGLSHDAQIKAKEASRMYLEEKPIQEILTALSIGSKATLYRYLRIEGINITGFKKY